MKRLRRTRRELLGAALAVPTMYVLAQSQELLGLARAGAAPAALPPTPACPDADDVTPPQTEGPFYKTATPRRSSLLEPGMPGTRLLVTGYVLSTSCRRIPGALLDFWQCDAQGAYDTAGFRLRGHQFADADGRYALETIVPGLYAGRTRHIHVKVQAPDQPVLTTQLYFPDEPANRRDGIFNPRLVMTMRDGADGRVGFFNFVLRMR
jgi:protocatechuate 3,4-dioxygenase beta subunit